MNILSTLLCGTTLLAATALAAPAGPAPAQPAGSPCLPQSAAADQASLQPPQGKLSRRCALEDADQDGYGQEADAFLGDETQRRLDEVAMLSRQHPEGGGTYGLNWLPPQPDSASDDWEAPSAGGPGSVALHRNPLYASHFSAPPLREQQAGAEIPAVPEPATWGMLIGGLALVAGAAARQRRRQRAAG